MTRTNLSNLFPKKSSVGDFGADLDPVPTPDPTLFFSDFKNAKKIIYFQISSYILPTCTLSSVLEI
jgi:hypothetical protein